MLINKDFVNDVQELFKKLLKSENDVGILVNSVMNVCEQMITFTIIGMEKKNSKMTIDNKVELATGLIKTLEQNVVEYVKEYNDKINLEQ